jgi:proteasome-associated ATPase
MAIKRSIANAVAASDSVAREEGIREADLQVAFNAEYLENEILPATDITEDWLKLIDYDPDNVVKISPVRMLDRTKAKPTSGVI